MRYTAFYLIDPLPTLRARLQLLNDHELEQLLLDSVMLSHQEGGRSFWSAEDHTHIVKLLFLAQLKEYKQLSCEDDFEKIFESSRINTEVFDRWWTIRRLMVDEAAESLYPSIKQLYHLVDRTENDHVNEWLNWVYETDGQIAHNKL